MSSAGRSTTRNPLILFAGVLLIVSGVLGVLGPVRVLGSGAGAVEVLYLVVATAVAALSIWAGWLVLHRDERGRIFGIVLAVVGAILALISVVSGSGVFLFGLIVNAFIALVLVTRAKEFA